MQLAGRALDLLLSTLGKGAEEEMEGEEGVHE